MFELQPGPLVKPNGPQTYMEAGERRPTVLLVDDRAENLLALEAVLGDMDLNMLRAASGEAALKHLLEREIALILLDVRMPRMDGFETAALIRSRDKCRHIPIIFVTAVNTEMEHVSRGYSLGAVDYILKPFPPEILRSKVSVFVELFRKSEQVRRQAREIQEMQFQEIIRREQEKRLVEVQRYARELEMNAKELARSNEELEQFAYVASHDLQEPLRKVGNYAQLLERAGRRKLDPKGRKYLEKILEGADRMHSLIRDLLNYSRVSTGESPFETIEMESVLESAVSNLDAMIKSTGAVVTHDPLPSVWANSMRMQELLQNLIQNGVKFQEKAAPQIHVSADRRDSEWIFSVRDNGIGIDPRYFDRIFVIFQRLHPSSDYPGNGMGLTICKRIVERHGGKLWVESEPGRGATFRFSVPMKGGM
ncbi:MAG: response regulator [Nitrospirae bacterium]|nr:response regulator [Nitrospirota bacterium]